jgi:hypothetical protein
LAASGFRRRVLKSAAVAAAVVALAGAAFTAGRDWIPRFMSPDLIRANTRVPEKQAAEALAADREQQLAALVRRLQPSHWPRVTSVSDKQQVAEATPADGQTTDKPATEKAPDRAIPPQDTVQPRDETPRETAPREPVLPPVVPVKIQELRAPNGGICLPVVVERRLLPSRIDVAMDAPDRFHETAAWNLCGLEWTLAPEAAQSGVQGFDIDLPGFVLSRTGTPGAWTRIAVEFRTQLSRPVSYNVNVKYDSTPRPEQVQQFRHTISTRSRQAGP